MLGLGCCMTVACVYRFAALGNYQSAPWFVAMADKILEGSPSVIDLLDDTNPMRIRHGNGTVSYLPAARIKATLYT